MRPVRRSGVSCFARSSSSGSRCAVARNGSASAAPPASGSEATIVAVDLGHHVPSGRHRQALQSCDPLERIVVVHRAEPQHDRLGLRRRLLGHLAARERRSEPAPSSSRCLSSILIW